MAETERALTGQACEPEPAGGPSRGASSGGPQAEATRQAGPASLAFLTRSSAVNMGGGIVSQALKFLVIIYVARTFSSAQFGSFSFAVAVNAYMFIIAHFGLPLFGTRAVAQDGCVKGQLLATVAWTRASLALFGMFAAVAILSLARTVTSEELLLVAMFGFSNVALAGFYDWAFQGLARLEVSAVLNTVWQFLWMVFTVIGVRAGGGIMAVPIALCLSAAVVGVVGWLWLRRAGQLEKDGWSFTEVPRESWKLLKAGAPLGVGTMLITVLVWTDTIIVRLVRSGQEVGWYAAGNRVALAVSMLVNFYLQGAFPFLSRASSGDPVQFQRYFQRAYDDLALFFVPGSVWGIFYAPEIMHVLFKRQEYLAGVAVFRIFQLIPPLIAVNYLLGIGVLVTFRRDWIYQKVLLASVAVFLFLCPLFTFRWGIRGAAHATLVSHAFSFILFAIESRSLIRPGHRQALLVPCLLGLAAAAVGKLFALSLLPALSVLSLAYTGLLMGRARAMSEGSA